MSTESLLSRIGRVIAGMAHATVDAAEQANPEAVLEQAIREIDEAAGEVRAELGLILAERHRIEARRRELDRERDGLNDKITVAVGQRRDDLAEAGIARQLDIEAQLALLDKVLADCAQRAGQCESTLQAVNASRREAVQRLAEFKESRRAAASAAGGAVPGGGAESKVARAQATMERVTGVPGGAHQDGKPLADLEALARSHAIKERLARIKVGQA